MSTDDDNRNYDRDKELQDKDRDQKQQEYDRDIEQQKKDRSTEQIQTENPERLQDNNHRMDQRTNEVQGEVSYDQNRLQETELVKSDNESRWKDIEEDYRKRYPNITDEDVNYRLDGFDDMTGRIAKRTNRNREDVNNEIRDWHSTGDS
ncbi:hypothetical protein [Gelidibacter gilvus]|uniref:CsbD family protein n=1 Tax=Gelidibacter gilvus TaxID=59602 RepID=A0A4Q0XCQ1_9FLAO|nr:hypothetical protein [Gelidibacter gilvus]RXJ44356.1 hypothetical protein ESZ48_18325 [Gelidibacter gilvus]